MRVEVRTGWPHRFIPRKPSSTPTHDPHTRMNPIQSNPIRSDPHRVGNLKVAGSMVKGGAQPSGGMMRHMPAPSAKGRILCGGVRLG